MNTLSVPPTPVRITQVESQINLLRKILQENDELVSELQPAFTLVLRLGDDLAPPVDNGPSEALVPIASHIRDLANIASDTGSKLRSILARREV